MTDKADITINEVECDNVIRNVILQFFLLNTLQTQGTAGKELLKQMRQQVTAVLLPPSTSQSHRSLSKSEEFAKVRIEKFFQPLDLATGIVSKKPDKMN